VLVMVLARYPFPDLEGNMAAIAFDTLKAARRMIEAGMPPKQAEAQAEVMAEAFVFNVDSLVTRDYLDARLDARFAEQGARIDVRFTEIDGKFRVVYWMLGLVILTTSVPVIRSFLGA
jgi:hypothetical protein